MKKILIVGLVVVIAVYAGLMFFLGSIVKAGVNSFGPKLTQSRVELSGATLSPLTGAGTLRGLTVGNPKGWSDNNALALGRVHIEVRPQSLFGDHIEIREITIENPEFLYETKLFSSNIKDLLKNIESFGGGKDKAGAPATKSGKPIRFVVHKFRLSGGVARIGTGVAAVPVPLPPVSMDEIGVKEGGIAADQLAGVVLERVLASVVSGAADALTKVGSTAGATTAEKTQEAAKKAGEGLKKLLGGKP